MSHDIESAAATLVAAGKGILAADETVPTLTKRFDSLGIPSTEQSRRTYREMLFTAVGEAEFISGVILQDETIHRKFRRESLRAALRPYRPDTRHLDRA
jgi:fructose-bisphosphate aldolase class I